MIDYNELNPTVNIKNEYRETERLIPMVIDAEWIDVDVEDLEEEQ